MHRLPASFHSGVDVDVGELDEGGEDEDEAHGHPDVDGFEVGHARQVGAGAGALGGHR